MVRANVFTAEDIEMCAEDENSTRRIEISDVISYMESNEKYANSKLLHATLLTDAKNN